MQFQVEGDVSFAPIVGMAQHQCVGSVFTDFNGGPDRVQRLITGIVVEPKRLSLRLDECVMRAPHTDQQIHRQLIDVDRPRKGCCLLDPAQFAQHLRRLRPRQER